MSLSSCMHLEVRELGLVAGLVSVSNPALTSDADAAAEHRLLAEEIGLRLLRERGLEDARARAADAARVGERALARVPGRVLVHREERGHALPGDVRARARR